MNRKEFLGQLERLLWDIPEQERREALEYYSNYFEDAGEENESGVIQELGSPGKVAAIIKADLAENRGDYGEYTESGYTDERFDERKMPDIPGGHKSEKEQKDQKEEGNNWDGTRYTGPQGEKKEEYDGPYRRAGYGRYRSGEQSRKQGRSWPLILVIIILTSPIWGGIGLGILGGLLGLVLGLAGVLIGLLGGCIGLIVGGAGLIVDTLLFHLSTPAVAMVSFGTALLLIAAGILFMLGFAWIAIKCFPALFRWCIDLIQRFLHRGMQGGERR